ncbi:MAG: EpsI family protein [Verrucomicrobia bacterium]|nr:EpsI family protein [Verrucomicrobiota bacterium]
MNSPRETRFSPWLSAAACAAAGAILLQWFGNATRGYIDSASLFYWWGFQWVNPASETEHGLLILPLAIGVFIRNLRNSESEIRNSSSVPGNPRSAIRNPQSAWPAFAALVAGLLLHAVGFAAQQTRVSVVALLVFLWGVLRLGGGKRWGDAAVFPVAFLAFAIPFNALDSVGFWLRLWVIKASGAVAHAAGIGVIQNGTQLLAPDGRYQYDVAAACSGVRSLVALLALAVLYGYLTFRARWRRASLVALCFPLIYLGNVARILSVIFAAQAGGQAWGGRAHDVMGYGVFVIVLGGVMLAARLMPESEAPAEQGAAEAEPERGSGKSAGRGAWAAGAVVALAVGEMFFLAHLASLPPRGQAGVRLAPDGRDPVELPLFLGTDWIGRRVDISQVEREILPPDTGYSRREYVAVANPLDRVYFSVVLSGRDRSSIHRPELCLVGQGWTILQSEQRDLAWSGGRFPVTLLHVRREVRTPRGRVVVPQLVAYWFVGGDTIVGTQWARLAVDAWNRVIHGRADRWAYILVQADAREGDAAALGRMRSVMDQVLPDLMLPAAGAK